jgi:hypothetical protein
MNDDNSKKLINAIDKNDTATASSLISSGIVYREFEWQTVASASDLRCSI